MKSNLITTLPYIAKEYKLSFDVFVIKFKEGWTSIVHFTVGEDKGKPGERIPAVYITKNLLCVAVDLSGNPNHHFYSKPLESGKWIHIEVAQTLIDGKVSFCR